jgi:hypothetical protein
VRPDELRFGCEYWLIRIWSKARVKKAANVETNGVFPRNDRPSATSTMFCSAMNISKKRAGVSAANTSAIVELLTSPSRLTTSGNAAAMRLKAAP